MERSAVAGHPLVDFLTVRAASVSGTHGFRGGKLIEDQAVRAAAIHMVTLTCMMRDAYATTKGLTSARAAAKVAHAPSSTPPLATSPGLLTAPHPRPVGAIGSECHRSPAAPPTTAPTLHPCTRSVFLWSSSRRPSPGSAASRRQPNRGSKTGAHGKPGGAHEAFASVFDAASERVMEAAGARADGRWATGETE